MLILNACNEEGGGEKRKKFMGEGFLFLTLSLELYILHKFGITILIL